MTQQTPLVPMLLSGALLAMPVNATEAALRLSEPVAVTPTHETFGAPINDQLPHFSLSVLLAQAEEHLDKTIQLTTTVGRVCQKKGCFFVAQDGTTAVRVSFRDYGFFVPTDTGGKEVLLVGRLVRIDRTTEQAEHLRSDAQGHEPALAPGKVYEIVADAVRIPRSTAGSSS